MGRIEINGSMLNVERSGSGPALLLLHGFTGSVETWHAHLPALTPYVTAVAVDLIGHGASDAPDDPARYAMDRCVADLLALLDRLEIERTAVLGYSMGARVALHLAAAAPRRVQALLLESGSPGLAGAAERAARRAADEALAGQIERDGVDAFVQCWERLPLFATQRALPPEVRAALRRQRQRNRAHGLANSLRGLGTGAQQPLWERLGEIEAPALLVAGALDAKFSAIAQAMVAALPRGRMELVPQAGHAVHLERPAEFDHLVVEFVVATSRQPSAFSKVLTADN